MSSFGDFTKLTYVNDSATPAINAANLNAMQDKINTLDDDSAYSLSKSKRYMIDYWMNRSYKAISLCDDVSNWTAGNASTTISQDTTNSRVGYGGIKVLENDSSAGYVYAHKTVTALNLTTFQNGVDAASTSDGILWVVYVSDKTKIDTALTLKLGTDNSNNYYYTFTPVSIVDGWNAWFTLKSNFSTAGSVNWNNITYLHMEWYSYASATNAYVTLDFLGMYRANGGVPGVTMVENAGSWATETNFWTNYLPILYYDHAVGKSGFALAAANAESPFKVQANILNFACQTEWYVTQSGELPLSKWYYDSDNYIDVYVTSGTAYLYLYQAGSATTVSQALPTTLSKRTRVIVRFEKNGTQVRAIFSFSNQSTIALESVTTLTNPGSIYLVGAKNTSNAGLLTDFIISGNPNIPMVSDGQSTVIVKQVTETVTSSTSLQDDDEFNFSLPANGLYEIEAVLYVAVGSTTSDVKTLWVLGGGSSWKIGNASSIRAGIGMGTDATSSTNAETVHTAALGMGSYPTTAFAYGTHTSTWSTCIIEKHIVNVTGSAGTCKLQWAQNTSNANGTSLNAGSYVKITKLVKW
jgi:hypothetical protein